MGKQLRRKKKKTLLLHHNNGPLKYFRSCILHIVKEWNWPSDSALWNESVRQGKEQA